MAKRLMTDAEFADIVEASDALAQQISAICERWPFGRDAPPPDLEVAAQTVNRLAENALGLNRLIISRIALAATERELRAKLTAEFRA